MSIIDLYLCPIRLVNGNHCYFYGFVANLVLEEQVLKFNKQVYQNFALIGQFGINMLVPIFLCSFIGIYLDNKLGTNFIVIILFFVGAVSGGYNIYRFSKKSLTKKDPYSAYIHGADPGKKKETDSDAEEHTED